MPPRRFVAHHAHHARVAKEYYLQSSDFSDVHLHAYELAKLKYKEFRARLLDDRERAARQLQRVLDEWTARGGVDALVVAEAEELARLCVECEPEPDV